MISYCKKTLPEFRELREEDFLSVKEIYAEQGCRYCEYTAGVLFLWAEYFGYSVCIRRGTLFVKGRDAANPNETAFALPVGGGDLDEPLEFLSEYAKKNCGGRLVLNCVPEEYTEFLVRKYGAKIIGITEMTDWNDYLYSAEELAALTGRRYNKKRNRVNLFLRKYKNFSFGPITADNLTDVREFLERYAASKADETPLALYEIGRTRAVLNDYFKWGFDGAALYIDGVVRGFTAAETVGDTMFVHIEKAEREFDGAYQMINYLFAREMLKKYGIRYINREDAAGDPGLVQARLSYNPIKILRKYRVEIEA
ncbi:MAG: phosphatidylglycerol lysyltransferase domain-containing protein [Clostridiales bacterium]|nr:phosphatidylglycerol lysyltransferase domain-containing protein [Clostridiales bacterium]